MQKSITFTTHCEWKQYIDSPSYFRGSIRSDGDVQAVYLTDSTGKVLHNLLKTSANEAQVFLYIEHPGHYTFHLVPVADASATVDISLQALPLKRNQIVSPKLDIISPLLSAAAQDIAAHNVLAETIFWQNVSQKGTPLIEQDAAGQTIVTFLYQGDASTRNVLVLGTPYDGQAHLSHLSHSDIWFKSYVIPESSRFSYRIAVNVPQLEEKNWTEQYFAAFSTIRLDPKNQQATFGEPDAQFGAASTLTLPSAPSDLMARESDVPRGNIEGVQYHSDLLGNTRLVQLYHPNPIYSLSSDAPLLMVFDGSDYLTKVPTTVILDNLIAKGAIPPMRAVFIDTPSPKLRAAELTPNAQYAHFLATEFKPWLRSRFNIHPNAQNTVLAGSSFGGLASMYIAFKYPEQFGKVLSQSGSFWWAPETRSNMHQHWFDELVSQAPTQPIEIYMNAGLFEISPKSYEILDNNRRLVSTLKRKGYTVTFEELASGHDYFSWRATFAQGLIALFKTQ